VDRLHDEKTMARYRKLARETVTEMQRIRMLGLRGKEMGDSTDQNNAQSWRPTTRYGTSICCPRLDQGD
jgi:hypothetical protein